MDKTVLTQNEIVVVVPIYKEKLNAIESASLVQCCKVLHRYDIVFVTHRQLDLAEYYKYAGSRKIEYFDTSYFDGIEGYNRLCLSKAFYLRFVRYKYMLIYQLDAWVFDDELLDWCNKGYDYIGAPWQEFYRNTSNELINVGNGGFSLRRIAAFLNPYSCFGMKRIKNTKICLLNSKQYSLFRRILMCIGYKNNFRYLLNNSRGYLEDVFWSVVLSDTNFKLNIPNEVVARSFAFECKPSVQFDQNGMKLPFGCHAFEKHEFDEFWSKYIHL